MGDPGRQTVNAEPQDREQTGQLEEGGDRQVRVKARVKGPRQGDVSSETAWTVPAHTWWE